MTIAERTLLPAKATKQVTAPSYLQSYPMRSVRAAGMMALKSGNNDRERADYTRILIRESQELASYIIDKTR